MASRIPSQRNAWVNQTELPDFEIHIEFNDQLSSEERIWFNDLLIAGLYPKFQNIKTFAQLLRSWKEPNNREKLWAVKNTLRDSWELKHAFNYMLLGNIPPDNAPPYTLIPLTKFQQGKKMESFTSWLYADYDRKYDDKKKFRKILTDVVERKAIRNGSYKFILYALYMYRTHSFWHYPDDSVPIRSFDEEIRYYFSNIADNIEGDRGNHGLIKQQAQKGFFRNIKSYIHKLHHQDVNINSLAPEFSEWHCLILVLRNQQPYYWRRPCEKDDNGRGILLEQHPVGGRGWKDKLIPFQILLGEICTTLRPHCVEALLDFKLYLLHLHSLCHRIINIGFEPGWEFLH